MRIVSLVFAILGILCILLAFFGRLVGSSMVLMLGTAFSSMTFLIISNTCLLLAVLSKTYAKNST